MALNADQKEALLRIPIVFVSWIILKFWGLLTLVFVVLNFFYTLFKGKRHKGMAEFTNTYITFVYSVLRYMCFTTNKRPFPFYELKKPFEKVEMK